VSEHGDNAGTMMADASIEAPGDTIILEHESTTAKPARLVKVTSLLKIIMLRKGYQNDTISWK
jgi:hypothetical protein